MAFCNNLQVRKAIENFAEISLNNSTKTRRSVRATARSAGCVFDNVCRCAVQHVDFRYYIVLAYPLAEKESPCPDYDILPDLIEKIENIPSRFALNYPNKFMFEAADIVVTYVQHS